jgi:hypothetical protein
MTTRVIVDVELSAGGARWGCATTVVATCVTTSPEDLVGIVMEGGGWICERCGLSDVLKVPFAVASGDVVGWGSFAGLLAGSLCSVILLSFSIL